MEKVALNEKTKKILRETDRGLYLTPCRDVDDLLQKLELHEADACEQGDAPSGSLLR